MRGGNSDYRVLAQLGFGLARAWLALAWLGLAWLGCDNTHIYKYTNHSPFTYPISEKMYTYYCHSPAKPSQAKASQAKPSQSLAGLRLYNHCILNPNTL